MRHVRFLLFLLLSGITLTGAASTDRFPTGDLGGIALKWRGRLMPLDAAARHLLLQFSGMDHLGDMPAREWLARVFFTPVATRDDAVFLVENPEVAEAFGLTQTGRHRYTFAELEDHLEALHQHAVMAEKLESNERSPVEQEFLRLYASLREYLDLTATFLFAIPRQELSLVLPENRQALGLAGDRAEFSFMEVFRNGDLLSEALDPVDQNDRSQWTPAERELVMLATTLYHWSKDYRDSPLPMIPVPAHGGVQWVNPWTVATMRLEGFEEANQLLRNLEDATLAFRKQDAEAFTDALEAYQAGVAPYLEPGNQGRKIWLEQKYYALKPFLLSEVGYGLAFLITLAAIPFGGTRRLRLALGIVLLALLPHTLGILARMYIMGRPPVTNLYATFLFVAWVGVVLGLVIESFQRNGLGLLSASSLGLVLLLVSGRFTSEGDTMGVVVAVLDSNFWLATHVICITIGYSGCVVAGLLGHIYLLRASLQPGATDRLAGEQSALYGMLAFGLTFSFLGTMLGGVWADQSWGRFWGWDPKENGALLIVIWTSILFHARLAGLVGPIGIAAGSVLGVIIVLFAWLGVNLLGVGLHSYGFTSGLLRGMLTAMAVELLFLAVFVPWAVKRRVNAA